LIDVGAPRCALANARSPREFSRPEPAENRVRKAQHSHF
jgi:hypothetical protein